MISFRNLGRLGRLGNQLFQYAATRLYAELNGFSFAFPHWAGDELFTLPASHSPWRYLLPTVQLDDLATKSPASRILRPLGLWRTAAMFALWQSPRDNINLDGYLQDEATLAMLRGHRDIIRGWFTFRPQIDAIMRDATKSHQPWTAVHVRRGDLMTGKRRVVSLNAYREALARIPEMNLFISSDDPAVASSFPSRKTFTISYSDLGIPAHVADFWILKESATLVAGGSTFAWWAAFLGNGEYWAPPLSHTWPAEYRPVITSRSP
jgi:hypothetical protein